MSERIEQNLNFADTGQNLPHPEILSAIKILCVYKGSKSVLANSAAFTIFSRKSIRRLEVGKLIITAVPNNKLVALKSLSKCDPHW